MLEHRDGTRGWTVLKPFPSASRKEYLVFTTRRLRTAERNEIRSEESDSNGEFREPDEGKVKQRKVIRRSLYQRRPRRLPRSHLKAT